MSCPICQKDRDPKYTPFCSKRCADIDLGKWFNESYRVPSDIPAEGETAPEEDFESRSFSATRLH